MQVDYSVAYSSAIGYLNSVLTKWGASMNSRFVFATARIYLKAKFF